MKFDQLTAHAEGKLLTGIVDRVGHVVINNPERHNAISLAMYQAGAAEVNRMAADPEARLLVVRGAGGKAFGGLCMVPQWGWPRVRAPGPNATR